MSRIRVLLAALALAVAAPAAMAAVPHFIKVSPTTVVRGHRVTVSGSVGNGCEAGMSMSDSATVFSRAFKGSAHHSFAGIPAVFVSLSRGDHFSFTIRIRKAVKKGSYHIGGRCGGGNFGSATLKVK